MSSILTNNSAMIALQTLKSINMDLGKTQSAISTGKEIASAKDNSAIWSISKTMESDVAGYEAVEDSLGVGGATVGVALAGAEQITDTLIEMKQLVVNSASETTDVAKVQTELAAKYAQIDDIISSSQFNGINLLNTAIDGASATSLTVTMSLTRVGAAAPTQTNLSVATADLEATIGGGTQTALTAANSATVLGEIEGFLTAATAAAANFGSAAKRIESQSEFVSKLQDSLSTGIGALVDADMEETSAKLSALQTQQQLGVQALSIANQAPQSILSLFR